MHIQFQLCGLCILGLLIVFYKSHKNLRLYKEKLFFFVLCMITVSLMGDVLSLFAIKYRSWLTPWFVKAVCKTYLVCLICGSWSTLIYILADFLPQNKHKKIGVPMILLMILEGALILLTPIYIYDQADQVYTYGPSVMVNYLFNVVHIISILTVTYVFRKKLNPRRRFSITLWMLIWIVAAGIQFMNNELLLVGFASALGVLVLFTVIENPESNIERRLGCFNSYALNEYLIEMYETRKDFSLLEISLDNLKAFEERSIDTNEIMKKLVSLCKKDVLLFKNIQLSLVLTSPDKESLTASAEAVMNEFSDSDIFLESATLTLIPHANIFSNPDELFRFLAFVQNECTDKRGTLIQANDELISKFRDQYLIEQEIRDALTEDRVELFLQPIYSNNDKCFTSAEALMRIRKRDNELLSPGLFIPIAEKKMVRLLNLVNVFLKRYVIF